MLRVVIIDGIAMSRNLLGTILTNGGHEVVGDSNTGAAGLARMIKLRPQIVCIDIGHEEDGGMALLDAVRGELPKSLVFMVSGKMSPENVHGALQRGVHGFIVKPFNADTVLTTIRNAILKLAREQKIKTEG
ncbi:MAG TPA: response regulator [Oxalobacteraceae bacterium]|nr:response regulator [Oxalobacteraceae bacterium]